MCEEKINSNKPILVPASTRKASEVIYEQLKGLILDGSYKPGDRMPSERVMMEQLKRSRPTIREALRMLERDGYIQIIPGSRGSLVLEPNTGAVEQSLGELLGSTAISLEEIADMRMATEIATAGWAAERRSQEDLEKLEQILQRESEAALCINGEIQQFVELDPAFHEALGNAACNRMAAMITRVFSHTVENYLSDSLRQLKTPGRREMCKKIVLQHQSVYKAVKDKDIEMAKKAMGIHVQDFGADLQGER